LKKSKNVDQNQQFKQLLLSNQVGLPLIYEAFGLALKVVSGKEAYVFVIVI
jgi:hypothetical protein